MKTYLLNLIANKIGASDNRTVLVILEMAAACFVTAILFYMFLIHILTTPMEDDNIVYGDPRSITIESSQRGALNPN